MSIRSQFDSQLDVVKMNLLKMGRDVDTILNNALKAFDSSDQALMDKIINEDYKINQLELSMHDEIILLISKQQPVASDLRKLIVALKISSDLERVADLAVDLAKQSKRMTHVTPFQNQILEIGMKAQEMLLIALESYEKTNILVAQKIATMDDRVDQMYGQFIRELFSRQDGTIEINQITQLAFIGRFIERIADYATNIAEWVIYEVNGKHFDLN
ncbi:phosphate signaling complex protein PhoU [Halalkalibacter sp. APA_J-10(15)]|uniref:phosphate signaling complex protein PhoU n=1 Tax=unclassified Halalkalibacter TaxID=2893063 RepID=UPI001FF43C82|nr:phosphate signaling complex protein PhoU [Halalkalibacter sp. APA_J-10(15)]MCK0473513.1 phosphate signaling complex protein PhoU [Halalkalibacter sp. APA_J-10(15)]